MTMPWWAWATISVFGFAGTALLTARLAATGMTSAAINFYLFAIGLVIFALYALFTGTRLSFPAVNLWWFAFLAITLFVSNYAVVAAYGKAPNVGLVKALGALDLLVVALAVALTSLWRDGSLSFTMPQFLGLILCLAGAILVAYEPHTTDRDSKCPSELSISDPKEMTVPPSSNRSI
ncbi:MAG: hypothetical protein U0796_21435 [Gemmatales bacterium]